MITPEILAAYAAHIKTDYVAWQNLGAPLTDFVQKMIDDFTIVFEEKTSYILVIKKNTPTDKHGSAHSFIVKTENDKKFPLGSILKAASYKAPAKNFPRGNVLVPESYAKVRWTGA